MTTDRELLELAAKAAGFNDAVWAAEQACVSTAKLPGFRCFWNPLTNDGDALRLAVKLRLLVSVNDDQTFAAGEPPSRFTRIRQQERQSHGSDPYAATRRAIVRAAAEIGRSMT
jgi:hypothetical protein